MADNKPYIKIQLNKYGDTLKIDLCKDLDNCKFCSYDCNKKPMLAPLQGPYVHDCCGGFVDVNEVSDKYFSLNCRACNMREMVPKSVKTNQDLQDYFSKAAKADWG